MCEETALGMGSGLSSLVSAEQGAMTANEWHTRLHSVAVRKLGTERITIRQPEEQGLFNPKLWHGSTLCHFVNQCSAKKAEQCAGSLELYCSELTQNQ
jgi:hypothetical protein